MPSESTTGRVALAISTLMAVVVVSTIAVVLSPSLRETLGIDTGYRVDGQIDLPASAYASTRRTVFFFALSDCPGCRQVQPALAGLAELLTKGKSARFVLVTSERRREAGAQYAADLGLAAESVIYTDLTALKVRQVPALVVVDNSGSILFVRDGAPSSADIDTVARLAGALSAR